MAPGDLLIGRGGVAAVERDTQLRLLAAALQWVASADYRPRAAALEALLDRALAGGGGTLHGARIFVERDALRVSREYNALKDRSTLFGDDPVWDQRWIIAAHAPDTYLRVLGADGLEQFGDLPADAPPKEVLMAWPALFSDGHLAACALSENGTGFHAKLTPPGGSFVAFLESR